jgi:hypothetical protein
LNLLSNQISNLTTEFGEGSQTAAMQMNSNEQGVGDYLTNLTQTNSKIKNYNTTIDNILKEIYGENNIPIIGKKKLKDYRCLQNY